VSNSGPIYFNPDASGIELFLGPTEALVMELAWKHKEITVKTAHSLWPSEPRPAYNTIGTIVAKLAAKGLLSRHKVGRNFHYQPSVDRESFIRQSVATVYDPIKRDFAAYIKK
jgi:predicted transcriptional regulator